MVGEQVSDLGTHTKIAFLDLRIWNFQKGRTKSKGLDMVVKYLDLLQSQRSSLHVVSLFQMNLVLGWEN